MSSSQQDTFNAALDPEDWVDAYGNYLFRYAYSRLRDVAQAEEVVQDTFLAGIRNVQQFDGRGSQRGWLMGILKRKVIDHIRRSSRLRTTSSLEERHDPIGLLFDENGRWKKDALPTVAPDTEVESKELWQVVRQCLSRIPKKQADVFVLSVMEEMQTDEICQALEISPSNVWIRLHRARLGLAKCVSSKWLTDSRI